MLPPGHIAGGYLTTLLVLAVVHPAISAHQYQLLLWFGTFIAFAPDLDFFFLFWRSRTLTPHEQGSGHRTFYTHRPFAWLIAALILALATRSASMHLVALLIWTGSWTHFLLDSFQWPGIMWLWPFSNRLYSTHQSHSSWNPRPSASFWEYWIQFVGWYAIQFPFSFWFEIVLILIWITIII